MASTVLCCQQLPRLVKSHQGKDQGIAFAKQPQYLSALSVFQTYCAMSDKTIAKEKQDVDLLTALTDQIPSQALGVLRRGTT